MNDTSILRAKLIEALRSNPKITLAFTKTDGSTRVMNCTLMRGHFPVPSGKESSEETIQEAVASQSTLRVYDLDKNAWRSFRLSSLLSVNFPTAKPIEAAHHD